MARIKKSKKTGLFGTVVSVIAAVILILSSCTMGAANLLLSDDFYANITIRDLMYRGISGIIKLYFSQRDMFIGLTVLLCVAVVFYIIIRISEKCDKLLKAAVICALTALALRCIACISWNLPQTSDFKLNYELCELLSTIPIGYWGRFLHEMNTMYVSYWSAHLPFILYQTFVIKSGISLGFLNALYGTVTCFFTSLIAKELFGKRAFITAFIIMAVNPLEILFTPVLSNQHIATMFFVVGVWLMIKSDSISYVILSAISVFLSQLFRPEMTVAVIGIIIYYVYTLSKKKRIINAIAFAAVFMGMTLAFDAFFRMAGLISGHIFSNNLGYKLCVGFNKDFGGGWNKADEAIIGNSELIRQTLLTRLSERGNILHIIQKLLYQFGSYVYPWVLDSENYAAFSNIICRRAVSAYMIVISLISAMKLIKNGSNKKIFAISIIISGYMAVFALIEVQARYNYLIIPLLTVLASDVTAEKKGAGNHKNRTM